MLIANNWNHEIWDGNIPVDSLKDPKSPDFSGLSVLVEGLSFWIKSRTFPISLFEMRDSFVSETDTCFLQDMLLPFLMFIRPIRRVKSQHKPNEKILDLLKNLKKTIWKDIVFNSIACAKRESMNSARGNGFSGGQ